MKILIDTIQILLDDHQRRRLIYMMLLISFGSFLEVIGIGMIIPTVMSIIDPSFTERYPEIKLVIAYFLEPTYKNVVIFSLALLLGFYIFKSAYLIFMTIEQGKFIYDIKEKTGTRLFSGYMYKPYQFFLVNNSSQLIRNLSTEVAQLGMVARAAMTVAVDGLLFTVVILILLYVEPLGTGSIFLVLTVSSIAYQSFTKDFLLEQGKARQYHEGKRIQHIQQGISSVKDVKILGREEDFLNQFFHHNTMGVRAERFSFILASVPRLFLEFVVVIGLIVLVAVLLISQKSTEYTALILGIYAVSIFRLLPSVNRILGAAQKLRFSLPSVKVIADELTIIEAGILNNEMSKNKRIEHKKFQLKRDIVVKDLYFKHDEDRGNILENINFKLDVGKSVGIVGGSGGGKSTLIDIIMGLFNASRGQVLVDGKNIQNNINGWQRNIGYVAQNIYLTDDTLRRNIAFGVPESEIEEDRIQHAIDSSQLRDLINELPEGDKTLIGEQGIRLSGGQRQRIGIARALYHDPSVLIFDEATSALDQKTESEVMETIDQLHGKKTIIMVSHRINTLSKCDHLLRVERGRIIDYGSFEEIN